MSVVLACGQVRSALAVLSISVGLVALTAACGSAGTQQAHPSIKALAAEYLAIAKPANHQLDHEGDEYKDGVKDNLGEAQAALLGEANTESHFDQQVAKIPFPPKIEEAVQAMLVANERRIKLTRYQAESASLAQLRSFTDTRNADNAAVEAQTRVIREELGLPPPETS